MVKLETIIAVKDIQISKVFYKKILDLKPSHGGDSFEILKYDEEIILCLHKWGEHEHPRMRHSSNQNGNGLILFFRVDDLNCIYQNALRMEAKIEKAIHYNPNSLKNQFTLFDPDGYYIIISN